MDFKSVVTGELSSGVKEICTFFINVATRNLAVTASPRSAFKSIELTRSGIAVPRILIAVA